MIFESYDRLLIIPYENNVVNIDKQKLWCLIFDNEWRENDQNGNIEIHKQSKQCFLLNGNKWEMY